MACALESHFLWQRTAADRGQEEEWQGDRDRRREWERLSPAQQGEVQQAAGVDRQRVEASGGRDLAVVAVRHLRSPHHQGEVHPGRVARVSASR